MLVAALQIKNFDRLTVFGFTLLEISVMPLQVRVGLRNRQPACAGVKPHIENVGFLPEALAAAVCALRALRHNVSDIRRMPRLRALVLEQLDNLLV